MKTFNSVILLGFLIIISTYSDLLAKNFGFEAIKLSEIKSASLSAEKINGSDNAQNQISAGTILLYKTDKGRYGKLLIRKYGKNLSLKWVTYRANGNIFSKGDDLNIRGTFSCDLDLGKEIQTSSDFWWQQVTNIERYLIPQNGAIFSKYRNSECSVQGIKRIFTSSNLVKFQVQYYIPSAYSKACFISAYIPNQENMSSKFRYLPAGKEPDGVPKGQHYFSDNVIFEAEYIGSLSFTSTTIEVVIYDKDKNLCSSNINWGQTWEKQNFPTRFTFCGKNPDDSEFGSVDSEEIQGITHDEKNWYISNKGKIFKTKKDNIKSVVLKKRLSEIRSQLTGEYYNHFGDMDFYNGLLYVATTGKKEPPSWKDIFRKNENATPIVVVFDEKLNFIKYAKFPSDKQEDAAWVAINPLTGYLYSAGPYKTLHVYSRTFNNGSYLEVINDISLNFKHGHASGEWWNDVWNQGGTFSPHGIFYYVLDNKSDEDSHYTGIHAFTIQGNLATEITIKGISNRNENVNFMNVKYDPDIWIFGWYRSWELEGITVWDHGAEGQIHLLQLHNEVDDDDVNLFHFKVNNSY